MNTKLKSALSGLYKLFLKPAGEEENGIIQDLILIHKKSGLLIIHKSDIPSWKIKSRKERGELISGMLTAIKHFVEFVLTNENSDGELKEIKHSDCTIKINTKEHTVLAAVLPSGNEMPYDFDAILDEFHQELYSKFGEKLAQFNGDNSSYRVMGQDMRRLMQKFKYEGESLAE